MITSPSNPLVKDLVRLRSRRHREREGLFSIEGRRPLEIALEAGVELAQVVVCPELGGDAIDQAAPVVEMAEVPFRKASIGQNPDGVLGVARHLDTNLDRLSPPPRCLLLVVEAIEKPGNLGAMLRSADAAGADAVIVTDPTTDVHNPNVVRASQGALFTVPLAVADTQATLAWLAERRISLVATSPEAAVTVWDVDLTGSVAVAIGAEADGLSATMLGGAQSRVAIPMRGRIDSLNASVTAALLLYEAVRQRSHA